MMCNESEMIDHRIPVLKLGLFTLTSNLAESKQDFHLNLSPDFRHEPLDA